ncbi:hypothetical protein [Streptomyces qinzhouensis]|uniref:Uncharacterized protein n=1 Tax=Streptomyces qinzhouensis TaxID=2599401 RepID=A0A5B8JE46_9ACTN|nr:hypothetical protein [Streptomyces qinzhouensis]QDY79847.1 hypothetical protein FQU76_28630 [Streptomyces qinzhouensis]
MPIDPFAALNAMLRADAARAADFAEKRAGSQKQQPADDSGRNDEPEPRSAAGPGPARGRDNGTS